MERINFGYSVKNIPTPDERTYKLQLIEKTEAVIKRMRWKAIFHNPEIQQDPQFDDESECKENYGLKTARCPPQVVALKRIEEDLLNLASTITFRRTTSDFQKKVSKDMNDLRKSGKTLTPADKTINLYRLNKDQYNKLKTCLLYTSPSPRDRTRSRMPSSA